MFRLGCTSDKIWNLPHLIRYLSDNQGKDIQLCIDPEAICLRSLGLYDILDCFEFRSVRILTSNPFECHDRYQITHGRFDIWFDHKPDISPDLQDYNGKRVFLCLFGRPTAARLAIAGYLRDKYPDISHIHFSTGTQPDDLIHFEMDKLLSYDPFLVEPVGRLIKHMPLLRYTSEKRTAFAGYDYTDPLTSLYRDILVDVVVESHVKGNTFFPTEKIVRSIWMKKPFIVFASQNFLDCMHQMGFRSFADFWSEEYDGFEGKDRLSRILSVLDRLSQMTRADLESLWLDMRYTLDHNFDLLSTGRYKRSLTKID